MFGKIYILLLAYFVGIFCTEICLKQTGVCLFDLTKCADIASKCMENNTCCITDPAQNCDNIFDDISCESNAAKCNIDTVSKACPKTCKTCVPIGNPPPPCVDKVGPNGQSDCAKDAYLCNNAQYFDLMTQQCPKTCNRCPGVAPPPAGNSPPPP
uniref:ShKT domain-containing protein n=1 Tax=Panagrolaimus sp. PS1159 TaxID=55785 RepID=A0AC35FP02_9BILA